MEEEYRRRLREILNLSILENALNVYSLWEYKVYRIYFCKWSYLQNRDEFIRKLKICFLDITDAEITNFIRIYLKALIDYNDNEASKFIFENGTWISKISF